MAGQLTQNISMMARIMEATHDNDSKVTLSTEISALSTIHNKVHTWLLDSATSSHISRNFDLFKSLHSVTPVSIETLSGEAFTTTQQGTISITICSDPTYNLPDVAITLLDVIYVPKLNVNLMSIRRMTNTNIEVMLSKDYSSLSLEGSILAWGPKISNLFTYNAFLTTKTTETINYMASIPDITLWHHRLAHTNYSMLENMVHSNMVIGFNTHMKFKPTLQCQHCPFGKQSHVPFKGTEHGAKYIGDIIVSNICGPFKHSVGGYKYLMTWICCDNC